MGTRSDEHRQPSDMDSHTGKGRFLSYNYLLLILHTMMSIEPLPSMETPAVMPKGPVAVASDNPSYTLEVGNIFDLQCPCIQQLLYQIPSLCREPIQS